MKILDADTGRQQQIQFVVERTTYDNVKLTTHLQEIGPIVE